MSTVTVDPRIRARRVEVARDAGRRRLRRLGWLAGAAGVAAAGLAVTFSPLLDIEELTVRGEGHTSAEAITGAAGVATGDALTWFDTGTAEAAIAALPWVDEATVERTWSGSVTIEVTERVPAAVVGDGEGAWLLVDGSGRILDRLDAVPTDVPEVTGTTGTGPPGGTLDEAGRDAVAVAAAVPASLRPQVASLTADGDELSLALRAGGVVDLGGAGDAEAKLAAAAAVLATVPAGCVERLDVGVASAPALTSVPDCA
jgi:cell division protein FtsQ